MPIYEYECPECGDFEKIQKASDAALTECPHCAKSGKTSAVVKKISRSAFHLKGGGWYADGYASTPSKKNDGPSKSDSSSTKTENKSSTTKQSASASC